MHERHEAISVRKEAVITYLNEKNETAQLLITRYKELVDDENSRRNRDHRRTDRQIEDWVQRVDLRVRTINTKWR